MVAPAWLLAQSVVINEIAWMGTQASASDEWIELYNPTQTAIDLQGWHLTAADGTPSIPLTGIIPPGGFYVLERTDDQTISDRPADQLFTGDLKNSGEWLILSNVDALLIDQVRCDSSGWFAGSNSPKTSMEKKHPGLDGRLPSSWAANDTLTRNGIDAKGMPINGTPGAANSVFDQTLPVEIGREYAPTGAAVVPATLAAWPNPFIPDTIFEWQTPEPAILEILDLRGRVVRSWATPSGRQRLQWDGRDRNGEPLASGIYFGRLRRGGTLSPALRLVRLR